MRRSSFIVFCLLIGLFIVDIVYFQDVRKNSAFTVNEAFLNRGALGEILKENSLIRVSSDTEKLATSDMCATDVDFKKYDYHNTYRLRFKVHASAIESLGVEIASPKARRHRKIFKIIKVVPGREFYSMNFVAHKGKDFHITFTKKSENTLIFSDIFVDGRYGRIKSLLENGKQVLGGFNKPVLARFEQGKNAVDGMEFPSSMETITYSVKGGLGDALFSGVFPGKKNTGFCRYVAFAPKETMKASQDVVPSVNLNIEEKYLYGDQGIIDNKEGKGRSWEVPAEYSVRNKQNTANQYLGLRFHGGTPGRKKNIESFRINARDAYGKPTIDIEPLMGKTRSHGLKGVVFKYTYQAYDLKRTQYNPYNHSFALDIANAVGALVPAHTLIDLSINNESQGLYLAMEHLSKRTIRHWLGKKDFRIFTYKKYNDDHQRFALLYTIGKIMDLKGEDAFQLFRDSYDVNNVLNSIILSAYISDDDYCQGIEVIEKSGDDKKRHITSINWDLDHALLLFKDGKYSMPAQREGIGDGFDILKQNKPQSRSLCPRKWVYSHLYTESKEFRTLLHDRMQSVLKNELSPINVKVILEKYRKIDKAYYQGDNDDVIEQMIDYANKRPSIMMEALSELEFEIESQAPESSL